MSLNFNPDWTHLIVAVVTWLLGALGIGVPGATPNRVVNKTGQGFIDNNPT